MAFDDSDGNKTHGNHTHYHPTVLTKCADLPLTLCCLHGGAEHGHEDNCMNEENTSL